MFEASSDQAAGLRTLFPAPRTSLLALGCAADAAGRHAGVDGIVDMLVRSGRRPLLVDLLGERPGSRAPSAGFADATSRRARPVCARLDARALLPEGSDAHELSAFLDDLGAQTASARPGVDIVVVAAEPLRLADLAAGALERLVLLVQAHAGDLAHLYSQVKAMHLAHGFRSYCTVFADAVSRRHALAMHRRLADAADRFLQVPIDFGGASGLLDEACIAGYAQHLPRQISMHAH